MSKRTKSQSKKPTSSCDKNRNKSNIEAGTDMGNSRSSSSNNTQSRTCSNNTKSSY